MYVDLDIEFLRPLDYEDLHEHTIDWGTTTFFAGFSNSQCMEINNSILGYESFSLFLSSLQWILFCMLYFYFLKCKPLRVVITINVNGNPIDSSYLYRGIGPWQVTPCFLK